MKLIFRLALSFLIWIASNTGGAIATAICLNSNSEDDSGAGLAGLLALSFYVFVTGLIFSLPAIIVYLPALRLLSYFPNIVTRILFMILFSLAVSAGIFLLFAKAFNLQGSELLDIAIPCYTAAAAISSVLVPFKLILGRSQAQP